MPDEPRLERVKVSDIKPGPIQHKSLSPKVLEKLKMLYDAVGHYTCPTLEEWEIGFMRDAVPEREIAVWARIALAWQKFNTPPNKYTHEQEESLVNMLVGISMGVEKEQVTGLKAELFDKLYECYVNPSEDVSDGQHRTSL